LTLLWTCIWACWLYHVEESLCYRNRVWYVSNSSATLHMRKSDT
jgi:hypothetical protein